MEDFKSKYPTFTLLFSLIALEAQNFSKPDQNLMQKIASEITILPQFLSFIPQASKLGAEAAVLKASPADMEAGAEILVSDLAFSSDKAKEIIAAAFPVAEDLIGLISKVETLAKAIKA